VPIILPPGTTPEAEQPTYGHTVQDALLTLPTPSLVTFGNEPVPAEIMRDLISWAWVQAGTLPRPEFRIKDDVQQDAEQMWLGRADWVVIGETRVDERQHGFTYEFKDIDITVPIEIHTKNSRQRLYNVMAEVRRIIYTYQRVLRPYQQLYWDSFQEQSEGLHKYWRGTCTVRLTSRIVPVVTGIVTGYETPSRPSASEPVPQRQPKDEFVHEEPEIPVPPPRAPRPDAF